MIQWITSNLGTSAYSEDLKGNEFKVVDVRDLVDKVGNTQFLIKKKINNILDLLNDNNKVVICCDYGISRSNAIAVGVLCKLKNVPFDEALKQVLYISRNEIKIDVLKVVKTTVMSEVSNVKKQINNKHNILVLGANGKIGSQLVPMLQSYINVYCPSRHELDVIAFPSLLLEFCEKHNVNHILNLAYPRVSNSYFAFGEGLTILRNILEVLKWQRHIHLTHVSSWVVFSGYNKTNRIIVDETTEVFPYGMYSENKYFCENLIEHYLKNNSDLKISIMRLSSCYGREPLCGFIYNFIRKALYNEDIYVHEYINSAPFLQLTHLSDASQALLDWCLSEQKTGYYNLAGDDFLSTHSIAKKIIDLMGSSSDIKINKIEESTGNIFMNSDKIRKILKWEPKISFDFWLHNLVKQEMEKKTCRV